MYPGYRLRDALSEYAVVFFSLLNEGYRARYRNYRLLAEISLLPHMKDTARQEFLRSIDWASQDADDILKAEAGNGTDDIKRLFRKT